MKRSQLRRFASRYAAIFALSLSPAFGDDPALTITGRVLGPQGRARADVPVAAFTMTPTGPAPRATAKTRTDAQGRFVLELKDRSPALIAARAPGLLPGWQKIDPARRAPPAKLTLKLKEGQTISGRVSINDRPPAAGFAVHAKRLLAPGARPLELDLLWRPSGVLEAERQQAEVDLRGRFQVRGLARASYELALRGSRLPGQPFLGSAALSDPKLKTEARAPAADVKLEARLIKVRLEPEGLAPDDSLTLNIIAAEDRRGSTLSLDKARDLWLTPDRSYLFRIEGQKYERRTIRRSFPDSKKTARLVIPIVPAKAARAIKAELRTADGKPVKRGSFEIIPVDGTANAHTYNLRRDNGRYLLAHAPSGRCRVIARCQSVRERGFWVPFDAVLDLSDPKNQDLTCALTRGGRLQVTARDAAGAFIPARCQILDARGQPLQVLFEAEDSEKTRSSSDHLAAGGPSVVRRALAPGRYTLRLSHPIAGSQERAITIIKDRVCKVELRLDGQP